MVKKKSHDAARKREGRRTGPRQPGQDSFRRKWSLILLEMAYGYQKNFFLILVPLLVLFTYSHTRYSPFIFDDVGSIVTNEAIEITELSLASLKKAALENHLSGRPVSYITFAVNYFFHGREVQGYRYVNIIIHMVNGWLLFLFLVNTFRLPPLRKTVRQPFWVAYLTALIWVIHPLQVQSVTYIVQRMNSLATLFYMLAFYTYLKARLAEAPGRRRLLAVLSLLSGILALGSKEIAVTLPFFIVLYEWMFFQDLDKKWLQRNTPWIGAVLLFSAVMVFLYVGPDPMQKVLAGYGGRDFTLVERLLTQPRVILHYIDLFLYPHPDRLTLLPHFPVSTSLFSPPTTLFAILGTIALIIAAIIIARKNHLIAFCILWFFGNLVVESSVIPLEIIFQHRTYLPSMMLSLLATYLILQNVKPELFGRSLLFCALLALTMWTYERNAQWADKVYFWQDCLEKNPHDYRIYNNLGKALEEKGKVHSAITHYRKAIEKKPDHPRAYNNLGVALLNTGREQQAADVLHQALANTEEYADTHYNLGLVHGTLGELQDAEEHYLEAHEIFGPDDDPDVHNNMGILLGRQGRLDEAVDHFEEAIRIHPDDPFAHNNLGITLARLGRYQEAITHFKHALRINPDDRLAWNNLQIVIAEMKPER